MKDCWLDDGRDRSEDHDKEINSVNKMNEPRSGFSSESPGRNQDRQNLDGSLTRP